MAHLDLLCAPFRHLVCGLDRFRYRLGLVQSALTAGRSTAVKLGAGCRSQDFAQHSQSLLQKPYDSDLECNPRPPNLPPPFVSPVSQAEALCITSTHTLVAHSGVYRAYRATC